MSLDLAWKMTHADAMLPPVLPHPALLSKEDRTALNDLYARGTPDTTLRAYERDLIYITCWVQARFGTVLSWPEQEDVALRFVLDHTRDLSGATGPARTAADTLIEQGLRRRLACPAPATLDRRIASWRAFHRMKNLTSPFDAPLIRQARAKGRRANARPITPKSAHPITRKVLEAMLDTCQGTRRDCRDRAILLLGWASGGRRRSEITSLQFDDLSLRELDAKSHIWISLGTTKTTARGKTPKLILKGRAAQGLAHWIDVGQISGGPLFRPVSSADRVLSRRLSPDAIYQIVRRRLTLAGYPAGFASPHGLRLSELYRQSRRHRHAPRRRVAARG